MDPDQTTAQSPEAPLAENSVPTLLVGLGGIGSRIVERVFTRIPSSERDRVALHVFDTDVGDLRQRKHFREAHRHTAIGDSQTVGELRHSYPDVNRWLVDGPLVDVRSTIGGAGQIRSLGRLALTNVLRDPAPIGLSSAIDALYTIDKGQEFLYDPRVMIVSSLAGGTGSGTFLQVALLCRSLIRQKIGALREITVRGFGVLPDVVVENEIVSRDRVPAVRANAMATVKELEAIRMGTMGYGPIVDLEYDGDGATRPVRQLPFDVLFLMDHRNEANRTLSTFDDYLTHAARCLHLALFSPLLDRTRSKEDNNIRGAIEANDRARYASASSVTLRYPLDEIVRYLACRWGAEEIEARWLGPDDAYQRQLEQYENDLKKGVRSQEPERSDVFKAYIAERANDADASDAFFTDIHLQAHVDNREGRAGVPRAQRWIEAIEEEVRRVLAGAPGEGLGVDLDIDKVAVRKKDQVRSHVAKVETTLERARRGAEGFVRDHLRSIASRIMTRDVEDDVISKGEGRYRLNYWMFDEGGALHPLAVRYVLYEAQEILAQRIERRDEAPHPFSALGRQYARKYDDPATADRVETAVDAVDDVFRRGPIARLLRRNDLMDFADSYERAARRHYAVLQSNLERLFRREVFKVVKEEVGAFLQEWERFFADLPAVRRSLVSSANDLEQAHRVTSDGTTDYVLGSSEHKQRLWAALRERLARSGEERVSTATYRSLYRYYSKKHDRPNTSVVAGFASRYVEMLEDDVSAMQHLLPTSIAHALEAEARYADRQPGEHVRRRLDTLTRRVSPFLQLRGDVDKHPTLFHFWGLHPDTLAHLPEQARTYLASVSEQETDRAYSPNEMIFYQSRYLIEPFQVVGVTPGRTFDTGREPDGAYYTAYLHQVAKLLKRSGITHHLAKDWHLTLPDFWDERHMAVLTTIRGVASGSLYRKQGAWSVQLPSLEDPKVLVETELAPATKEGHLGRLYQTLLDQPDVRDRVMVVASERLEAQRARDMDKVEWHHHFIRTIRKVPAGGGSLFDLIVESYVGDRSTPAKERAQTVQALFRALGEEVKGHLESAEGDPERARRRIHEILRDGLQKTLESDRRAVGRAPASLKQGLETIVDAYRP